MPDQKTLLEPEPQEQEEESPETRRRQDPELWVMGQMLKLLDKLDEEAQPRVVDWFARRFKCTRKE